MLRRKKARNLAGQKEFEFNALTPQNRQYLNDTQVKLYERQMRIGGALSLTPEKVYSNPELRKELFEVLPQKTRMDALRGLLKGRAFFAMGNAKRKKISSLAFDEKKRQALLDKINSLSEEELANTVIAAQKLTGGKFDSFVLKLLKK
ncbi:MAG: hypothetical protein AABW59_03620 [archaeon]